MTLAARLFPLLTLLAVASAGPIKRWDTTTSWNLNVNYQGDDFYNHWTFETFDDPTKGRTDYVDQSTAQSEGLAWSTNGQFGMTVDSFNVVDPSARGRKSVRIQSNQYFDDMLVVADIPHMPSGCATWPAFWTIGTGDWPSGGEIDIVEGTNDVGANLFTLHTGNDAGCTMPWSSGQANTNQFTTIAKANKCDGGAGCNFQSNDPRSFGPSFNQAGGGYFVMRRRGDYVAQWFFPREGNVPAALSQPGNTLDETTLGTPAGYWPATDTCNLANDLTSQQLIFNIALCGGWASGIWKQSPCNSTWGDCFDFVNNHPEEFKEAYWIINSVRVYS